MSGIKARREPPVLYLEAWHALTLLLCLGSDDMSDRKNDRKRGPAGG